MSMMDIFTFRPSHIRKLFTHEDIMNIHKTIGGIVLSHYIYRFKKWYDTGSMGFDPVSPYTVPFICTHALLSLSSLLFRIPSIRNKAAPMIWPEFRLHSIIFAMRSISVMLVHVGGVWVPYIKGCIILFTMFLADEVTRRHPPQGSTMRAMKFPDWVPSRWITVQNRFYSICQIYATLELIFRNDMSYAFSILFPIQIAAFLMTCVRKGIITSAGWHFWYTVALLSTALHAFTCNGEKVSFVLYNGLFVAVIICRFYMSMNKYIVWSGVLLIHHAWNRL